MSPESSPASGSESNSKHNLDQALMNQFVVLVRSADSLQEASDRAAIRLGDPGNPLRIAAEQVDFGLDAFAAATFFLGAATNSLVALRLLTVREVTISNGNTYVEGNITVTGTAGLVRQALECAAKAHWLSTAEDPVQLSIRGFAAIFSDAEEAVAYLRAIGSPQTEVAERNFEDLLKDGREKGFINENNGRPKPTRYLLGATDILRDVRFTHSTLSGLDRVLGDNVNNGEWPYRWLSGMAHGRGWVHARREPLALEESSGLVQTRPDWIRLSLSTGLAISLINTVLSALNSESPYVKSVREGRN